MRKVPLAIILAFGLLALVVVLSGLPSSPPEGGGTGREMTLCQRAAPTVVADAAMAVLQTNPTINEVWLNKIPPELVKSNFTMVDVGTSYTLGNMTYCTGTIVARWRPAFEQAVTKLAEEDPKGFVARTYEEVKSRSVPKDFDYTAQPLDNGRIKVTITAMRYSTTRN